MRVGNSGIGENGKTEKLANTQCSLLCLSMELLSSINFLLSVLYKSGMPADFAVREGYKNEEADHPIGFLR